MSIIVRRSVRLRTSVVEKETDSVIREDGRADRDLSEPGPWKRERS